jgi:hypothetical protein
MARRRPKFEKPAKSGENASKINWLSPTQKCIPKSSYAPALFSFNA